MRNIDKIRQLEHELGRYRKKVADQAKELSALRQREQTAVGASLDTGRALDAWLAQFALTFGEKVTDEDSGAYIGYRLQMEMPAVDELLGRYEVRARRSEKQGELVIGVLPREEAAEEGPEP